MRNKMSHEEYREFCEGKDVPASLEDGHSGKHIVGEYEQVNQKHRVKRIDENDDA